VTTIHRGTSTASQPAVHWRQRGSLEVFNHHALFENYEEAGDHDERATLEIRDGRYLVFSRAGLYHALYDILCDRLLVNEQSPFHAAREATGAPSDINSPEWPRFYLQWKLTHLHQPIAQAMDEPRACEAK